MFPGGQPNMQQLLKQAQKMQEELGKAQKELAETKVSGSAGGGLVEATVTGAGELVALTIAPAAVDPEAASSLQELGETLADLVLAAVRDASAAAQKLTAERMGPLTQGLGGGGIPGLPF